MPEIEDRTSERLAQRLSVSVELEGIPSAHLDRVRGVTGSAVLQRELLRRAIRRGEEQWRRLSIAAECVAARLGRQRAELERMDNGGAL